MRAFEDPAAAPALAARRLPVAVAAVCGAPSASPAAAARAAAAAADLAALPPRARGCFAPPAPPTFAAMASRAPEPCVHRSARPHETALSSSMLRPGPAGAPPAPPSAACASTIEPSEARAAPAPPSPAPHAHLQQRGLKPRRRGLEREPRGGEARVQRRRPGDGGSECCGRKGVVLGDARLLDVVGGEEEGLDLRRQRRGGRDIPAALTSLSPSSNAPASGR